MQHPLIPTKHPVDICSTLTVNITSHSCNGKGYLFTSTKFKILTKEPTSFGCRLCKS